MFIVGINLGVLQGPSTFWTNSYPFPSRSAQATFAEFVTAVSKGSVFQRELTNGAFVSRINWIHEDGMVASIHISLRMGFAVESPYSISYV